jgi:hypothetical protein
LRTKFALIALAGLFLCLSSARAEQITYTFSGHVNSITDPANLLSGRVALGDPYNVSVTASLSNPPQSLQTFHFPWADVTVATYNATVSTQIGNTFSTQTIASALTIGDSATGSSIYVATPDNLVNSPATGGYSYALLFGSGGLLTNSVSQLPLSLSPSNLSFMFTTHIYDVGPGPIPGTEEVDLVGVNGAIDSTSVNLQATPEPSTMTMGVIGAVSVCLLGWIWRAAKFRRE